ncbi:MAG: type 1 glutamine amidotransferase domain-containing protein [Dehalococcoidia bacterium]
MSLEGKKIAILVEADFEDDELTSPLQAMRESGAEVTIVGTKQGAKYRGKRRKAEVVADAAADGVSSQDFDAVIVPGGYAPDKMRLHQPMIDLVRKAYDAGKLIAAVCHGPQLLISAEIVKNKRMTSWPSIAVDLKNAGADWADEELVRDGNLITSRRPSDLPMFNKAIIVALGG